MLITNVSCFYILAFHLFKSHGFIFLKKVNVYKTHFLKQLPSYCVFCIQGCLAESYNKILCKISNTKNVLGYLDEINMTQWSKFAILTRKSMRILFISKFKNKFKMTLHNVHALQESVRGLGMYNYFRFYQKSIKLSVV